MKNSKIYTQGEKDMLPISRVIVSFVYYNSLVRDTLEYTLKRDQFDVKFYDYKRNGIVHEIELNTPLKGFIEQNSEKGGPELLKQIQDFIAALYDDKSTIIVREENGVRIDHAQDVTIFDKVIPLHEQINAVIRLHDQYRKEHNEVEESITNLLDADERFYRSVALFTLARALREKFDEFNKAMRENNGQPSPQSNFVSGELNQLVKNFYIVRENSKCHDPLYTEALDAVSNSIEMMSGKRDLPTGKKFGDVFNEVSLKTQQFLLNAEEDWKKYYQPAVDEMIKDNQKIQEEKKVAEEGENK